MRRGVHRIHIRNLGALQLLFDVQECWHMWQLLGSRRDAAEERALARPDGDEDRQCGNNPSAAARPGSRSLPVALICQNKMHSMLSRPSGRRGCAAVSLLNCRKAGTGPTCLRMMLGVYAMFNRCIFDAFLVNPACAMGPVRTTNSHAQSISVTV